MKFKPTYLYIKEHSITGLLYFGKSAKSEEKLLKYNGSGTYWNLHLKKHGKEHVRTLWYRLFLNEDGIKEFALNFSKCQDIVNSHAWANLKPENGLEGGCVKGISPSKDARKKMSDSAKISIKSIAHRKELSEQISKETLKKRGESLKESSKAKIHRKNLADSRKGISLTEEHRKKIREGIRRAHELHEILKIWSAAL